MMQRWSPVALLTMWKRRRDVARCIGQWPDTCALIANGLRAGLNLAQAIELAAAETPPPLQRELQQVVAETAVGKSIASAVAALEQRIPAEEVTTVAHAVAILHAGGGNLVALFDRVVAIVREQQRVRQRIATLTAQGKMTGTIVTAMPFAVGAIVALGMPRFVTPLFTTTLGRCLLLAALVLQGAGLWWMRRIVRIRI